ncbi:ATP-binding protein, partial [candidate division TA06 bacterium]|nr:ATP-binding protein [candidate division TA06 bacterium]
YTDSSHQCSCNPQSIQKYLSRVSGPLLDRIDIHIEVPALKYQELSQKEPGEPSAVIQKRVDLARQLQLDRYHGRRHIYCNAHMQTKDIRKYCGIDAGSEELLRTAISKFGFSARAYDRILKVSRTIADLDGAEDISATHISEAIQYRSLDRNVWGQ